MAITKGQTIGIYVAGNQIGNLKPSQATIPVLNEHSIISLLGYPSKDNKYQYYLKRGKTFFFRSFAGRLKLTLDTIPDELKQLKKGSWVIINNNFNQTIN